MDYLFNNAIYQSKRITGKSTLPRGQAGKLQFLSWVTKRVSF